MNVFYDHDVFSAQRFGGISRYFAELLKRLPALGVSVEVFAGLFINEYVRGSPHIEGLYVPTMRFSGRVRRAANDLMQQAFLRRRHFDLVHHTFYAPIKVSARRQIITVHDMIPEVVAGAPTCGIDTKRLACHTADHIIAISECTKRDLVDCFHIDSAKVSVIYHGCSVAKTLKISDQQRTDRPFLMFVGGRQGYKNFGRLLRAIAGSVRVKRDFDLVCLGGGAFTRSERALIVKLGLSNIVRQCPGTDADLLNFYSQARLLVCPSLYEGFGFPVLEAMKSGCPVVSSNRGALPEIGGKACVYFNPYSVDEMAEAITGSLLDSQLLRRLAEAGIEQASRFTWDDSARSHAVVYRALAEA